MEPRIATLLGDSTLDRVGLDPLPPITLPSLAPPHPIEPNAVNVNDEARKTASKVSGEFSSKKPSLPLSGASSRRKRQKPSVPIAGVLNHEKADGTTAAHATHSMSPSSHTPFSGRLSDLLLDPPQQRSKKRRRLDEQQPQQPQPQHATNLNPAAVLTGGGGSSENKRKLPKPMQPPPLGSDSCPWRLTSHSYLAGNFTPVTKTTPPVPITYTGTIPKELEGGMYVRNGGNPVSNSEFGRDYHWFDGDGMLTGVWFERSKDPSIETCTPHFVNQFILTDLCISSFENKALRTPILPSIATLVSPVASLFVIVWRIFRAACLVLISHFPGSGQAVTRISVANTSILYHDGRALATCESGPPIRVQLPGLETVGWYNGNYAEGETVQDAKIKEKLGFGGTGLNSWMREWTTGHPKVDPVTGEMVLFHCNFTAPYIHYSVIPKENEGSEKEMLTRIGRPKLLNAPVPGCSGGKMMHDFGVSKLHTVILDLPLTLTPFNLLKNQPVVAYEPSKPSRFGVFPRRDPAAVRWFETTGCCIFHTANTWDELDARGKPLAVNMLACRLTSASLVYSAGNIAPPPHPDSPHDPPSRRPISFFAKYDESSDDIEKIYNPEDEITEESALIVSSQQHNTPSVSTTNPAPPISTDDEEQCRLYYYRFSFQNPTENIITHQYALSIIPFEFPTVNPSREMQSARYIYGCSTTNASFGAALGKATKIDVIVKMNIPSLLAREPSGQDNKVVDRRSIASILDSHNANDDIQAFKLPPGCFAQEARFVPRFPSSDEELLEEDDGYLLFYVFDESQLSPNPSTTSSPSSFLPEARELLDKATSTLYVLSACDMKTVVCKLELPARVPYGLHGNWFPEKEVLGQRNVAEFRSLVESKPKGWRERLIRVLG